MLITAMNDLYELHSATLFNSLNYVANLIPQPLNIKCGDVAIEILPWQAACRDTIFCGQKN